MAFDWSVDDAQTPPAAGNAPPIATPAEAPPLSRRELRMSALTRPTAPTEARAAATQAPSNRAERTVRAPRAERAERTARAPRPPRRRLLPRLLSLGAMFGVGALLIATSVPANALMTTSADAVVPIARVQAQSLTVVNAKAVAQTSARDKYTVVSRVQQAAGPINSNWAYTNDTNGTIQWPFPQPVRISYGFGPRQVAGCSFCSTFHEGLDFDPGQGIPIGSIANGVVSQVVVSHAGLGNHVVIDHVVNGQQVQSVYGHMLDGSIKVVVGQQVKVADEIGLVGSTGESTGAHLHLEIHLNNVPIDPFAWLKANAN